MADHVQIFTTRDEFPKRPRARKVKDEREAHTIRHLAVKMRVSSDEGVRMVLVYMYKSLLTCVQPTTAVLCASLRGCNKMKTCALLQELWVLVMLLPGEYYCKLPLLRYFGDKENNSNRYPDFECTSCTDYLAQARMLQ